MTTPKYGVTVGTTITRDGEPAFFLGICGDRQSGPRAIPYTEAQAMAQRIVDQLNAAEPADDARSTYRVYFRETHTVTRRGYIEVRAETAPEAVQMARAGYDKNPDGLRYNDNSSDSEAEIFCVDRWDAGVDPDRSLCPAMSWDDLNLGVNKVDPIDGVA
jgi:hypothetical protein